MYIFAIRGFFLINYCMSCFTIDRASVYIFAIRGVVWSNYCMIGRQCTYLLSVVLSCLTIV